jgi:hypothetical protein
MPIDAVGAPGVSRRGALTACRLALPLATIGPMGLCNGQGGLYERRACWR